MKIPACTAAPRFYVAASTKEAFSSWSSLADARASYQRFKAMAAAPGAHPSVVRDFGEITGIVEVAGTTVRIHPVEAPERPKVGDVVRRLNSRDRVFGPRLTVKSIRVFEGDKHDIVYFEEGGFESIAAVRVVERAG